MTAAKALVRGATYRLPLRVESGRVTRWTAPKRIVHVAMSDTPGDRLVTFEGGAVSLPADAPCALDMLPVLA